MSNKLINGIVEARAFVGRANQRLNHPAQVTSHSLEAEERHPLDPPQVVTFVSRSIEKDFRLDPAQVKEHFDRIGRFRILVIGRSNSGKTTLLQRVCNTTELPEIFNAQGERVK